MTYYYYSGCFSEKIGVKNDYVIIIRRGIFCLEFTVFVARPLCLSLSGQSGRYEAAGMWSAEWLQGKQSQNWTFLTPPVPDAPSDLMVKVMF